MPSSFSMIREVHPVKFVTIGAANSQCSKGIFASTSKPPSERHAVTTKDRASRFAEFIVE